MAYLREDHDLTPAIFPVRSVGRRPLEPLEGHYATRVHVDDAVLDAEGAFAEDLPS